MTKTEIAKRVTSAIVGFTTAGVVRQIITNNTTPEDVVDKAAVLIGTHVLGAIAADASKKWTDEKIDALIKWWTEDVMSQFNEE